MTASLPPLSRRLAVCLKTVGCNVTLPALALFLAGAAIFLTADTARSAVIYGSSLDVTGTAYGGPINTIQFVPIGSPQLIGTNTYWPTTGYARTTNNGLFSITLVSGLYDASPVSVSAFGPAAKKLRLFVEDSTNLVAFNDAVAAAYHSVVVYTNAAGALLAVATTNSSTVTFTGDGTAGNPLIAESSSTSTDTNTVNALAAAQAQAATNDLAASLTGGTTIPAYSLAAVIATNDPAGRAMTSLLSTNGSGAALTDLNASQITSGKISATRLDIVSSDFTNSGSSLAIAPSIKIVPDGISLTLSNVTLSTPASVPGGLVQVLNTNLTAVFTNAVAGTNIPVFSLTNRLIIGTVPSFYSGTIGGFVPANAINPNENMTIQVSTDGGATWDKIYDQVAYNSTVLVSIYDEGGADDTCTNLVITGFQRPTYIGTTNDYRNQIVRVDDPLYNDARDAVNVETANSLATTVRASWSRDTAVSDVNLNLHDLIFGPIFREHVESGVWQLKANNITLISVTPGTSAGDKPTIETLSINGTNLLFSLASSESPKIQYKVNLPDALWTDLPGQSSYFSNSLWWVTGPAPNDTTTTNAYFRAYITGTNVVAAKIDFGTNAVVIGNFSGDGSGLTNLPVRQKVNIPILNFAVAAGGNGSGNGAYSTPPFYTQPALYMQNGATSGQFYYTLPDWVTNVIWHFQYEYAGTNALTWTNNFAIGVRAGSAGRNYYSIVVQRIFTLAPSNYTWVTVTNSWPDMKETNCTKFLSINVNGIGSPTNTSATVAITQVRAEFSGNYNGTNW